MREVGHNGNEIDRRVEKKTHGDGKNEHKRDGIEKTETERNSILQANRKRHVC